MRPFNIGAALLLCLAAATAFCPAPVGRTPVCVRPVAAAPKKGDGDADKPARITLQGLSELVALGLGAPNLGKFKGVDKETGTLKFELESNRFIAKDGKEYNSFDNSKATYFEYGQVDESADVMGNFMKFFSGGGKENKKNNDDNPGNKSSQR